VHILEHQPAQDKDGSRTDMDQLAAQSAFEDAAMGEEVHQAEETDCDKKREKSRKVGGHGLILWKGVNGSRLCLINTKCRQQVRHNANQKA
jgi:hypothetical protein